MRVWIIADKRYGDSDETHWTADVLIDPRPDADPDEAVWDRAEERGKRYATKNAAMKAARLMKSNVVNVAMVYQWGLKQVEGHHWDWEAISEQISVECIYDPNLKVK